jgi:hypothetical protein
MMKKMLPVGMIGMLVILMCAPLAHAQSKDFHVSVTIPHIPGVNSPAGTTPQIEEPATDISSTDRLSQKDAPGITFSKERRNGEIVMLKTMTAI